jgi:hypothetical protein
VFRKLAATAAVAVVLAGCTPAATGGRAVPVAEPAFDVTDLAALQSAWWTWAASAPEERNPVTDSTGEHCTDDQPDGVWLVAGSFGTTLTRRCPVPAGVPLAGPAVNLVGSSPEDCGEFMADATGEVRLDGTAVPLRTSDGVPLTFAAVDGNPVTGTGGEYEGYGCGLWFSVPALEPGEHVLDIRGGSGDLAVAVTYELTVSAAT